MTYNYSLVPTFVGMVEGGYSVYCSSRAQFAAVRYIVDQAGEPQAMKMRYCERAPTEFPVIFAGESYVGEGTVLNVSVPGCEISSKRPVEPGAYLEMKVLVPDNGSSLWVGLAKVRWCSGHRFGVEFIRMPGEDQVRLGRLVKQYRSVRTDTRPQPSRVL